MGEDLASDDSGKRLIPAFLMQGVTTAFIGNDGGGDPDVARVLGGAASRPVGINYATYVGFGAVRRQVLGDSNRPPSEAELKRMKTLVAGAMCRGAMGLSTGLFYAPQSFAKTDEVIAVARAAADSGGVYDTHMRDESSYTIGLLGSIEETLRIGREANIPVNIWHLKIGGRTLWGRMPQIVEKIQGERAKGLDVSANVYPYAASSTGLSTLAPDWAMEGGYDDFQQRLKSPDDRARIAEALRAQVERRGERGIYVTQIYGPKELDKYEKKFIEEIAREMGVSPQEALMTLFAASMPSPRVIYFSISEDDVRTALRQPWISIGSDGGSPTPQQRAEKVAIHPRATGTFPRVLGHYARNEKLFSIEEAVRRMTSQAAARANLRDRGLLREGLIADVVVFDPDTVIDKSTFEDPHQDAVGVTDVVVNGVPVLRNGAMTGKLPGRAIRGAGYAGRQR
jgi:N-acyl-D-aspartate/D-glutamate deacylase